MRRRLMLFAITIAALAATAIPVGGQPFTGSSVFEWGSFANVRLAASGDLIGRLNTTHADQVEVSSASIQVEPIDDLVRIDVKVKLKLPPRPDPPPILALTVELIGDDDIAMQRFVFRQVTPSSGRHDLVARVIALVDLGDDDAFEGNVQVSGIEPTPF